MIMLTPYNRPQMEGILLQVKPNPLGGFMGVMSGYLSLKAAVVLAGRKPTEVDLTMIMVLTPSNRPQMEDILLQGILNPLELVRMMPGYLSLIAMVKYQGVILWVLALLMFVTFRLVM